MAKVHSREYTNGAGCASRIEKRWDMRGLVNGESVKAFFFYLWFWLQINRRGRKAGKYCFLSKSLWIVTLCAARSGLLAEPPLPWLHTEREFFLFFDQTPSPLTACRARRESLIQPCFCRPVGRKSFGRATGGLLAVVRIQI